MIASRAFLLIGVLGAQIASSGAQTSELPPLDEATKVQALGELWGSAYLFHPRVVALGGLDWEQELNRVIPEVLEANDQRDLAHALNDLLAALEDPLMFVVTEEEVDLSGDRHGGSEVEPTAKELPHHILPGGIGHIDCRHSGVDNSADFLSRLARSFSDLNSSRRIVIDLRFEAELPAQRDYGWLQAFSTRKTQFASYRRLHSGWKENEQPSGYRQQWKFASQVLQAPPDGIIAGSLESGQDREWTTLLQTPVVFLLNRCSYLPSISRLALLRMQREIGVILEETGLYPAEQLNLKLPGGLWGHFRPEFWTQGSTVIDPGPDVISNDRIRSDELDQLVEESLEHSSDQRSHPIVWDSKMHFRSTASERKAELSEAERLGGLIKVWTVVKYFFPHLEDTDADWDHVLSEWSGRIRRTQTLREYYIALQRLTAGLDDSHVRVGHPDLTAGFTISVWIRHVEGKPVVFKVLPDSQAESTLHPGDEIVSINGVGIPEFEESWRTRISASTSGALYRDLYAPTDSRWMRGLPLVGDEGSELILEVRRKRGTGQIRLKRNTPTRIWENFHEGPPIYVLDNDIGYVNLVSIPTFEDARKAVSDFKGTHGLILDLRGYPKFGVQLLLRFLSKNSLTSGIFQIPNVGWPDLDCPGQPAQIQPNFVESRYTWPLNSEEQYPGRIVFLIDERTQSMPEDTLIYLDGARNITRVGSQTAGTDGSTTRLALPGGGQMVFTGMRVLFGDHRQFERIGITPDVEVKPTIKGLRSGIDEVLEKAVQLLKENPESRNN